MTVPIRTATKDINYVSLNRDTTVWYAGTDQEREKPLPYPIELIPADPKAWDTILKLSGRENTHLTGIRASQGKENVFDANNRSAHCTFEGDWGVTGGEGQQVFTIKGGCHHIGLSGSVYSRGTDCDIELGCWADQSTDPVHDIDLVGLRHVSGRPLTVVFGRVVQPWRVLLGKAPKGIFLPPGAKIKVWASLGEMAYWWAKRLWVAIRYP